MNDNDPQPPARRLEGAPIVGEIRDDGAVAFFDPAFAARLRLRALELSRPRLHLVEPLDGRAKP